LLTGAKRNGVRAASSIQTTENDLTITRLFDAPRTLVFAAWTEQHHLDRWQNAPQGFTVTVEQSDIRTGGSFRLCMRSPEGTEHWLHGKYLEVAPQERLVFTHTWLGADGKPGAETLVTITFTDRNGKTELTLRHSGFTSKESSQGHAHGWTSTLDRLAQYLSELK
jgi:uncharacterized protein YndB with AHSA1/START domain